MPYANGYTYRRTLTVDDTKVSGTADLTDFRMLVSGTYSYLATVANGGKVENANGYDIVFASDPDGNTPLDHEIHGYVSTTGEFRALVRIPTLDGDAPTVIYMFYAKSSISTSQENKTGVWGSEYAGVWHLQESGNGTTGEFKDSTSNANHGTGESGHVPALISGGKFGNQQEFDGDNLENIRIPDHASLDLSASVTISFWARTPGSSNFQGMVSKRQDGGNINYHTFLWANNKHISYQGNNYEEGGAALTNTFTKLTYVINNGTSTKLRINGATSQTFSGRYLGGTNNSPLTFGCFLNSSNIPVELFYGGMQEVRIRSGQTSDDWDTTEYNNENDPATFYAVGSETTSGVDAEIDIDDTSSGSDATSVLALVPVTDTASGVDSLSILNLLPVADTGSGVDGVSLLALLSIDDTSSGVDDLLVEDAGDEKNISDSGSGVDAVQNTAFLTIADTGAGVDVNTILALLSLADGMAIADDFNRANGAIGLTSVGSVAWDQISGTWTIASNKAKQTAAVNSLVVVDVGHGNVDASVAITIPGSTDNGGLVIRTTDDNNYLRILIADFNTVNLVKRSGGSNTTLASATPSVSQGNTYTLRVRAFNDLIQVWLGSSLVITHTLSAGDYTSFGIDKTKVGIYNGNRPNTTYDTFSAVSINGVDEISTLAQLLIEEINGNQSWETFDISPKGTLKGNAAWFSGSPSYLRLTANSGSINGQVEYTGTLPADFDICADIWRNGSADGSYFYFGASATPTGASGTNGGYIIYFDHYNNIIRLRFGTTLLASSSVGYGQGSSTYEAVRIEKRGNNFKVWFKNVLYIDFTDSTRTLPGNRYGAGAVNGGQSADHRIRNLAFKTAAVEVISILALLSIIESASGVDLIVLQAMIDIADLGNGDDNQMILASVTLDEVGNAEDLIVVINEIVLEEAGLSVDDASIFIQLDISDQGTGVTVVSVVALDNHRNKRIFATIVTDIPFGTITTNQLRALITQNEIFGDIEIE